MKQKIYCYFHNDDMDGWASSAVVKKKHPNAEFYGYNYEPDLPLVKGYDIVYMVDCSSSVKDMMYLMKNNKKFIWIDHHAKKIKDVYEQMGIGIEGLRDTGSKHSACVLTWQYLFPDVTNKSDGIPALLMYVEDMDIWKWEFKDTDGINMSLSIDAMGDRDKIIKIIEDWGIQGNCLIHAGNIYIKMRKKQIDYLLTTIRIKRFHGQKTGVVNSPIHQSFIGHEMLEKNPDIKVAMIWYVTGNLVKVSLRSRGDVDVAELASKYGGGGHKPASGFTLKMNDKSVRDIYLE